MNETTASISGDEVGAGVIDRFYPELAPAGLTIQQQPGAGKLHRASRI